MKPCPKNRLSAISIKKPAHCPQSGVQEAHVQGNRHVPLNPQHCGGCTEAFSGISTVRLPGSSRMNSFCSPLREHTDLVLLNSPCLIAAKRPRPPRKKELPDRAFRTKKEQMPAQEDLFSTEQAVKYAPTKKKRQDIALLETLAF